jgi:hypothetical protein
VSPEPEVTDDLEEKLYPEEIVGHSLPNKRKLRSHKSAGDPIIPVTVKFRVKLNSEGTADKLKARMAYRGDLQREANITDNTWCPVAGFRSLKFFLAMAAHFRTRVYQLDYVAAFLQSPAKGRKFTVLPEEWKDFMPELSEWFGVPLMLAKSLYLRSRHQSLGTTATVEEDFC